MSGTEKDRMAPVAACLGRLHARVLEIESSQQECLRHVDDVSDVISGVTEAVVERLRATEKRLIRAASKQHAKERFGQKKHVQSLFIVYEDIKVYAEKENEAALQQAIAKADSLLARAPSSYKAPKIDIDAIAQHDSLKKYIREVQRYVSSIQEQSLNMVTCGCTRVLGRGTSPAPLPEIVSLTEEAVVHDGSPAPSLPVKELLQPVAQEPVQKPHQESSGQHIQPSSQVLVQELVQNSQQDAMKQRIQPNSVWLKPSKLSKSILSKEETRHAFESADVSAPSFRVPLAELSLPEKVRSIPFDDGQGPRLRTSLNPTKEHASSGRSPSRSTTVSAGPRVTTSSPSPSALWRSMEKATNTSSEMPIKERSISPIRSIEASKSQTAKSTPIVPELRKKGGSTGRSSDQMELDLNNPKELKQTLRRFKFRTSGDADAKPTAGRKASPSPQRQIEVVKPRMKNGDSTLRDFKSEFEFEMEEASESSNHFRINDSFHTFDDIHSDLLSKNSSHSPAEDVFTTDKTAIWSSKGPYPDLLEEETATSFAAQMDVPYIDKVSSCGEKEFAFEFESDGEPSAEVTGQMLSPVSDKCLSFSFECEEVILRSASASPNRQKNSIMSVAEILHSTSPSRQESMSSSVGDRSTSFTTTQHTERNVSASVSYRSIGNGEFKTQTEIKVAAHSTVDSIVSLYSKASPSLQSAFADEAEKNAAVRIVLESASHNNPARSMYLLAQCYWYGHGIGMNPFKAYAWYSCSAQQGFKKAYTGVGRCFQEGSGVVQNPIKAVENYEMAAEAGYPRVQRHLSRCYAEGLGVEKDMARSEFWLSEAARHTTMASQQSQPLALMAPDKATTAGALIDPVSSVKDNPLVDMGLCYIRGIYVDENRDLGMQLLHLAVNLNEAITLQSIGDILIREGEAGIAIGMYRSALEQKDNTILFALGQCYQLGQGTRKDLFKAMQYYEKGANLDDVDCLIALAQCLLEEGDVIDPSRAFSLYYMAAVEFDNVEAIHRVASMYAKGLGVAKDPVRSKRWFKKALEKGATQVGTFEADTARIYF